MREFGCEIERKSEGSLQAFHQCEHGLWAFGDQTEDCQCQTPLYKSNLYLRGGGDDSSSNTHRSTTTTTMTRNKKPSNVLQSIAGGGGGGSRGKTANRSHINNDL